MGVYTVNALSKTLTKPPTADVPPSRNYACMLSPKPSELPAFDYRIRFTDNYSLGPSTRFRFYLILLIRCILFSLYILIPFMPTVQNIYAYSFNTFVFCLYLCTDSFIHFFHSFFLGDYLAERQRS